MPAGDPEAARHDISNALKLGDPGLADAAREAFTNGMALTFTVSACAVVVAAVIATLILRDRNPATVPPGPAPAEQRELAPGNPLDVPAGHPGRPLLRPRRDGFGRGTPCGAWLRCRGGRARHAGAEQGLPRRLAYVRTRGWDFLVRELMGTQPPAYRPAPIAIDPELLSELFA